MSTNHLLVWNARGMNNRARRNVVRDVAEQQRASIVCLQETKVANLSASMNADLTGAGFDFACLPAIGVAGGAVTSWRRDLWSVSSSCVRRFSVTVKLSPADGHAEPWWASCVFTREIWHRLLARVGFQHLCPSDESVLLDWWQQERMRVPESFRRGFDSLVLLVSWEVWKERNRRTFDSSCKTPTELVSLIRHEANDWIADVFRSFTLLFTPAA